MEQQNLWCGPCRYGHPALRGRFLRSPFCRRKKKCIKYSEEDDGHSDEAHNLSVDKVKEEGDVFSPSCEPSVKQEQSSNVPQSKEPHTSSSVTT